MSKAADLADKVGATLCKHATFAGELGYALTEDEIESFYHAARAEALVEAAEQVCEFGDLLRSMANREGK